MPYAKPVLANMPVDSKYVSTRTHETDLSGYGKTNCSTATATITKSQNLSRSSRHLNELGAIKQSYNSIYSFDLPCEASGLDFNFNSDDTQMSNGRLYKNPCSDQRSSTPV